MKKILLYTAVASIAFGSATMALAESDKKHGHHKGKMFEKMDTDSDGIVTKDEFMKKSEEHFAKMDTNGDGKVTKEEAKNQHEAMRAKWKEKHNKTENKESK